MKNLEKTIVFFNVFASRDPPARRQNPLQDCFQEPFECTLAYDTISGRISTQLGANLKLSWGQLGANLGRLGASWGGFWGSKRVSASYLGPSRKLGANLNPIGAHLGVILGAFWTLVSELFRRTFGALLEL